MHLIIIHHTKTKHGNSKIFLFFNRCRSITIFKNCVEDELSSIWFAVEHFKDKNLIRSHFTQIVLFMGVVEFACVGVPHPQRKFDSSFPSSFSTHP
jgi:hypothetical protein